MNRLSFFLLGLVVGVALRSFATTRRDSHSQSKHLPKGLDHEFQAIETAAPTLPFTVPHGVSSARIEVEKIKKRPAQADILNRVYRTADEMIAATNKPLMELLYGR